MPDQPTIIPALLGLTSVEVERQFNHVRNLSPIISYDVSDGVFVAPSTPGPERFPMPADGQRVWWHLMVERPARYIAACLTRPTDAIFVHAEAQRLSEVICEIRSGSVKAGLVLNPTTQLSAVSEEVLAQVEIVQVMTVEPGGQGRPFLPEMLGKLDEIKARWPGKFLAVDGGINRDTIKQVRAHQPDFLLVGSALTKATDAVAAYQALAEAV